MADHIWHDDNNDIMKLYSIISHHDLYEPLPTLCPVCGKKSGHIYIHRYDDVRGGSWVWCSSCHCYSHASYRVPDWWRNPSKFTILDLHARPDNLDDHADYIDDFINKLLAIHDDKELRASRSTSTPCEKCGTLVERIIPEGLGGTLGEVCPNCGWGAVTSYFDPIVTDQTKYQITLLAGNNTSIEIIRAVNQVSHRNLLRSRELILSAPQIIFEGRALEVHNKKIILDQANVLYNIEPDYLYE